MNEDALMAVTHFVVFWLGVVVGYLSAGWR
jgi:hypothetical protein